MRSAGEMIVSLNPCLDADEYLLPGSRPLTREELDLISKARAVLLPQGCSPALYKACAAAGPALFPEYGPRFAFPGKIGQSLLFELHRLPRPLTFRWRSPDEFLRARSSGESGGHGLPFIVKKDSGHEGAGVFLVQDEQSLAAAINAVCRDGGMGFVTQNFVPPGGAVLRVVIIGERTFSYWKRSSGGDNVIVTIARDAAIDHRWKPELQAAGGKLCRRLASSTGINLAAVDVIFALDEPPEPLLLEVNYFFGRRGLGGSENYYRLVLEAARQWVSKLGHDPGRIQPV